MTEYFESCGVLATVEIEPGEAPSYWSDGSNAIVKVEAAFILDAEAYAQAFELLHVLTAIGTVRPVGPDHLLLTVFDSSSAAGVVRYCAGRAIPELAGLLDPTGGGARPGARSDPGPATNRAAALPA